MKEGVKELLIRSLIYKNYEGSNSRIQCCIVQHKKNVWHSFSEEMLTLKVSESQSWGIFSLKITVSKRSKLTAYKL